MAFLCVFPFSPVVSTDHSILELEETLRISVVHPLHLINEEIGASLVAQWLRICLPMQGTRVQALVWEDPTCRGANGPVSHNC